MARPALNLISEDEITFLTSGGDDPYDDNVVLKKLFHPNLKLLIVTEGSEGCRYYTKVQSLHMFFICLVRDQCSVMFSS
ncbi:probable fructokinase-7 [Lotus japonicus]|uniref:probable fructokinase-7 n=1 Tax=Lotus japonicus TaxID=34305 RepID=UPI00258A8468|nr:probable fructokinase-7 [Lotus japonicus]